VAFAENHDSWLQHETAVEGRPKDTKVDRHVQSVQQQQQPVIGYQADM